MTLGKVLLDPVRFSEHFLRSSLWGVQQRILRSVAENPRTAVKACHASGKTFVAALAVLWFLARYQEAIVVTTAPTAVQVEKLLWGEIHSALARSIYPYPKKPTLTELKFAQPKRYAMGFTTSVTKGNEGVRFQGFHAEHILMVLDEAPGVEPKIWEAIEGARAGGKVSILALGNPTIASGPFHDAFTSNRDGWSTHTISAFDTPNLAGLKLTYQAGDNEDGSPRMVTLGDPAGADLLEVDESELDRNARPYLTTRRWVREKYSEWGPGNPLWESRVLGAFPAQAEDALLSLAWLEAAKITQKQPADDAPIDAGLDVAGPGEAETVLTARQGPRIRLLRAWPQPDPRGEVVAALAPFKDRLRKVNVDSAGIGWYIYLHLKDLGFPVQPVNVGEAAKDPEKYANLKAELYWGLRMRAQAGDLAGLQDEVAIGQLAGIRWKPNPRGQTVIESKDDARKRGVKSPDRAESIMLAFAEIPMDHAGIFDFYREQAEAAAAAKGKK